MAVGIFFISCRKVLLVCLWRAPAFSTQDILQFLKNLPAESLHSCLFSLRALHMLFSLPPGPLPTFLSSIPCCLRVFWISLFWSRLSSSGATSWHHTGSRPRLSTQETNYSQIKPNCNPQINCQGAFSGHSWMHMESDEK